MALFDNNGPSVWNHLKKRDPKDTMQYRDVYESQNLERSSLSDDRQSKTVYIIAAVVLTLLSTFIFWLMYSWIQALRYGVAHGDFLGSQWSYYTSIRGWTFSKFFLIVLFGAGVYALFYVLLMRAWRLRNITADNSDINQWKNDQYVALPEELQKKFDWFPDVGATSDVQFSSMISHMALTNKGLKQVDVAERAESDVIEDGEIVLYKGEIIVDEQTGQPVTKKMPIIDIPFMEDLYAASGLPAKDGKEKLRVYYDTTKIPYNGDGSDRDKLGKYNTVADLINADWQLPYYEPQRPAGAYLVDTAPVNTMVLAITRAGKGQTVIEPTLDMWTRERRPNNMVINDPKGELLVKFYVRATVRGFQVVQFNLINSMKTDIYNPLGLAADAAREGDFTKAALYVENIADVFFPLDGGDDPVWPNAANNAFKRAAYGLIDYYLEEEKELRAEAERTGMDEKVLETKIDIMWGRVTLYNTYQLFVQLTSKKLPNPAVKFRADTKAGKYDSMSDNEYDKLADEIGNQSKILWEDKPEADLLTLYFNATDALPVNSMRRLVSNANNALRSMAGAEKMLASVYGIAITAMSFFTDPTISTLTSGTPSQNVDLPGLSFPRCFGVRFHNDFLKKYHMIGMQARWMSYRDKDFKEALGKDFAHEDLVSREGWAKYYFKGKYDREIAYVKLEIVNPQTGMLIRTFYFQFRKSYQTSLDARYYVTDPILGDKIVKNGVLVELRRFRKKDGTIVYKKAKTMFKQMKIPNVLTGNRMEPVNTTAIVRTQVRYTEKPRMIFLVTPPHLMKYAKLILILIKQLVDLNFDKSYMTKSNQKPLYKTRFMLDELGNLQSEGHGISGFATMLSIGLGQEQQFTLILQTLQQLRDVYGDSVDKVVQGNTSNIVFLKSTDDSMLDTLQKMSGIRHDTFKSSKTVTQNQMKVFMKNNADVSYTVSTQEVPVISYNDMAFIAERNSIVFRAGDSPVWNRNQTILPMSWRLFKNTIVHPGHDYSLQTIPTLSSALDFDVRKNQPDFDKMLEKRKEQALLSERAKNAYKDAYGFSDYQIEQLDPDVYADEIMAIINGYLAQSREEAESHEGYDSRMKQEESLFEKAEVNKEQLEATREQEMKQKQKEKKIYAGGTLSREDIYSSMNGANHGLDKDIVESYLEAHGEMTGDIAHFSMMNRNLCSTSGELYIEQKDETDGYRQLNQEAKNPNSNVYAEENLEKLGQIGSYIVHDAFYKFLASRTRWDFAHGRFESAMAKRMNS